MINFEEARLQIKKRAHLFKKESIELDNAFGRILAESITADRDYPPFNRSAMDGFAIKSEDLDEISSFDIIGSLYAGDASSFELSTGQALKIMTGAPVPESANAVIRIEDCIIKDDIVSFSVDKVRPFNNISKQGEDASKGGVVLKVGTKIGHAEWSLLATVGSSEVAVFAKPKIAILTTGSELRLPNETVAPHQIRESNSFVLKGLIKRLDLDVDTCELVHDDRDLLTSHFTAVMDHDIIILTGGVSMGDADYVPQILADNGINKVFHKVAIKPGKPIWFGQKENGPTVFGLPGNPLSCQVTFKLFVEHFIKSSTNQPLIDTTTLPFSGTRKKKNTFDHFFPAILTTNGKIEPLPFNGSGDVTASIGATGLGHHPSDKPELRDGEDVSFWKW